MYILGSSVKISEEIEFIRLAKSELLHKRVFTWRVNGDGSNDFCVGIIRIEWQWITPAYFQRNSFTATDRFENVHHLVVREAQDARVVHVYQHISCNFIVKLSP